MKLLLATGFLALSAFMFSPLLFSVLVGAMRTGEHEAVVIIAILHLAGWAFIYGLCRNMKGRPK